MLVRIITIAGIAGILTFSPTLHAQKKILTVAFLDVGQGDAIYVEAPNGRQMIIDGGPGSKIMGALSDFMPFGDQSIDVLMVTNPDTDHFSGFIDVLGDYAVGSIIEPGTMSETNTYSNFLESIEEEGAPRLLARRGMTITLDPDAGVVFTVLFPDRDVSSWQRNDGSIVGTLSYGDTQVLFTGDATKITESIILSNELPEVLTSDILKIGHHGSRTSTSDAFVEILSPLWAIISDGAGNTYGHPHAETLDTLSSHAVDVLRTDTEGTITFVSNGRTFERIKK